MKKRILYVDDNPNNRLYVRRILVDEGYEMLEAGDGESGWQTAMQETPDVIFTDLLMPGIDGFELTRQIKSTPSLSHIPIITLTAFGNPETERIAKEAGSDSFLHKPATVHQIKTILQEYLGNNTMRSDYAI